MRRDWLRSALADPRHLQIAVLGSLLVYGVAVLDLEIAAGPAALTLASALGAQLLFARWWRLPGFDPRSPLISGLSLCLLLRANEPAWLALAAFLAVASKFALRVDGKHVFNPTNFALVVLLLATDEVWVSPGQWGSGALATAALVCAGSLVVRRATRSDVTVAFLLFWVAIVFGRSFWLGEPWAIPLHRLENGALLIFAFFMLSDPRTTPDSRIGRIILAAFVAAGAAFVQFGLYRPHGLLFSLAVFAPLVPFLDRVLPDVRFAWPSRAWLLLTPAKGDSHDTQSIAPRRKGRPGVLAAPARSVVR
jgi:Na+-transporting NADH:ubiquinone oxidoreductase subunit NqrB